MLYIGQLGVKVILVSGVWCLVSGVWCLMSGVWCLPEKVNKVDKLKMLYKLWLFSKKG
jgi:hypothetical protein